MTITAQYASVPKNGTAQVSLANTNRDGTGNVSHVYTASPKTAGGARIDALHIQAINTTTAGMIRFFLQKGRPGPTVSLLEFLGTTITVTTTENHGLTTGQTVTMVGAMPDDYNVVDAAITVTGPKVFTYVVPTAPTSMATLQGSFSSSLPSPVRALIREVPVSAVTPSATIQAYTADLSTGNPLDRGFLPLVLQPGWSLRASTEKAEIFNIIPTMAGDFA